MDPIRVTIGDLEITGPSGASSNNHGIVLASDILGADVDSNVSAGDEGL